MLTVKVFLESSGQIKDVLKDFNLYQGAYQDKLLNLYVPTAILLPNTTGVSGNAVYTACIGIDRQGHEKQSRPYEMDYVKTLTYQGVEYALYERKLPKAVTMQIGTAKVVFNIKSLDLSGELPLIVDQIDSGVVELQVMASRDIEETPIEPSETDVINARLDNLEEDVADLDETKQDKEDDTIFDYTREIGVSKTVVGALNNLDGRVTLNKNTNDTQDQDIDDLSERVANLEESAITGFHYVGTLTVANNLPTNAQLNAFVLQEEERSPQNGDKVVVIVTKSGETDLRYDYLYGASGWNGSEIPPIETAKNGELGIVEGTYGDVSNDTQVNIDNGKIIGIYNKRTATGTYTNVRDWDNLQDTQIASIITGGTTVAHALKAEKDGSDRNIVATYQTKAEGATKDYVKGYALPRQFNDRFYLHGDSTFKTAVPTSGTAYSTTFASIGDHTIFDAKYTVGQETFELTHKNSFEGSYFVTVKNNGSSAQTVKLRMYTYWDSHNGEDSTLLCSQLSDDYSISAGQSRVIKLELKDNFRFLQTDEGDTTISVVANDELRQTLSIITTSSTSFTVSVGIGGALPSSMFLNTQNITMTVYQGTIEEYESTADFPTTGESGTLYIALDENTIYRWDSSTNAYVKVTDSDVKLIADSTTLVDGIVVPTLTGDQLALAYNGLALGRTVTVESSNDFVFASIIQAINDSVTQETYVVMSYKDLLLKYDFSGDISRIDALIVSTEDTMNTSTLPAVEVPELDEDQVAQLNAYVALGKKGLVQTETGSFVVTECDETDGGICLFYFGLYLHYYVDGDNVICEYIDLRGRDIDVNYKSGSNLLSYNGDTVTITERYKNIQDGTTSTRTETIALANSNTAGLMAPSTVTAIQQMRAELDQLEGQSIRLVYTAKDNPTASEIGMFVIASGYTQSQFPTIGVVVRGTNHIWRWYNNTNAWQDIGVDTVNQFTNAVAGVIKGSTTDGQVYAEDNGTGSVNGWSALKNAVANKYDANNPPPYPVTSVAGKTGAVSISKSDVGLGNVGNYKAVSTVASQGLTDTEKSNARANIGAGTSSFSGSYNDLTNKPTIPSGDSLVSSSDRTNWNGKQDTLVSGTNIKTVNNTSILGSGNLSVQGVTELPNQYNRITDLEAGVYKLTYNGTKYLYYNGSTSTTTHTVTGDSGSVILVVSKYSTTYWHWYYINGMTSYATLYYGYTSASSGSTGSKAINSLLTSVPTPYKQVPNSTYATFSLGYYLSPVTYGTSSNTLNTVNFLYPGQYSFSLGTSSSTTYGAPYTPTSTVRALLITNAPYYTGDTTYRPFVEQEIIVFDTTVRHFKRKWTASSSTFGAWEEEDYQPKLVSGTNIKTVNGNSLLGSGDLTVSGGAEEVRITSGATTGTLTQEQYNTLTASKLNYIYFAMGAEIYTYSQDIAGYLYYSFVLPPTTVSQKAIKYCVINKSTREYAWKTEYLGSSIIGKTTFSRTITAPGDYYLTWASDKGKLIKVDSSDVQKGFYMTLHFPSDAMVIYSMDNGYDSWIADEAVGGDCVPLSYNTLVIDEDIVGNIAIFMGDNGIVYVQKMWEM